jgi:hypothetical protein
MSEQEEAQLLFGIPGGLGFVDDIVKQRAHTAVTKAIKDGELVRPKRCEECGKRPNRRKNHRIVAHHDDYNKPLQVRWLCSPCHGQTHRFDCLTPKRRKRRKRIALSLSERELAHIRAFSEKHWFTAGWADATMCRIILLTATSYEMPDDE